MIDFNYGVYSVSNDETMLVVYYNAYLSTSFLIDQEIDLTDFFEDVPRNHWVDVSVLHLAYRKQTWIGQFSVKFG